MRTLAAWLAAGWLAAIPAVAAIPVAAPAGPERFYYQDQWGTRTFQLLRTGDGGLNLAIQQPGNYTFNEDGLPVEGWEGLTADWERLAGVQIFPVVYDFHGGAWVGRTPARPGNNKWVPADFAFAREAGRTGAPPEIFRVGWQVHAGPGAGGELKTC
jgi:hypothetical protein